MVIVVWRERTEVTSHGCGLPPRLSSCCLVLMLMCECQEPFLRPSSSFLSSAPSSSSWPSPACPASEKCGCATKVATTFRETQYQAKMFKKK